MKTKAYETIREFERDAHNLKDYQEVYIKQIGAYLRFHRVQKKEPRSKLEIVANGTAN